jgi:molecular chaperone DnaK
MSKQIVSKAIGIDLGTTNSVVAVMNPTDTDIIIHRDAIAKRETTPSCVWKDPKTGEIVVGHKAFRRVGTSPSPIRAIKRLMGTQTKVLLTDEEVTPEQVSAWVLGEMKRQIEEDVARFSTDSTKWIVDRAIITVPAYFDMAQIDATRKAGEMAGLQVLDLLHEPTAAACYHCFRNGTQNGVFLVYHFGGGTFDVTVLRYTAGVFEVLGISGNNRLGGDDIDAALAENIQERLLREGYALELDVKNDPEDRLRFDKLKFLAEGVKKALSTSGEFLLRDTGTLQDKEGNPAIIEEIFERSEVEEIIKPIVERTIPYCFEALERTEERAGVKLADIDAIILAGGSTHIPLVREMVRQNLCADPTSMELVVDERANQPRAKCVKPVYEKVDTIVALGTAIRAAAVGGLAIYNPERTVRVSFREAGATGQRETHIGGKVEALD